MKSRLYAMRRNTLSKDIRKHPHIHSLVNKELESPADKAFPEQVDIKLYESLFWSTFKDLPDTCRQLLLMHWKDLNLQEISQELNTSESIVKDQKCSCTQKFVQMVKRHKDYKLLSFPSLEMNSENTNK
jgi:DNA-directed RNA polymerase specialized sigma24 family protein